MKPFRKTCADSLGSNNKSNPSRKPKKSKLHFDVSKDVRKSKCYESASRRSSSSDVSSDEVQSCSSADTSNNSSKSRFKELSYSRRSRYKSDSDSGTSSGDSVKILETCTIGGRLKKSRYKNVSKKARKARSRSRYRKQEKSYDKLKHISHEKHKKSRKRRHRKKSVSSVSSDSASHSKYNKSRRTYLNHDYRSHSRSVSSDGRDKNCQGVNDLRDKISNSKLTNDLRERRNEVDNRSKEKFQGRYYGTDIKEDANYELNKHYRGQFQGRFFETGTCENELNKMSRDNVEERFYETDNKGDRDWFCNNCGNLNYHFRIWCNRCNMDKHGNNRTNQNVGGVVKKSKDKKQEEVVEVHWGKSVKKDNYIKNYVGGKYRCDICDVTVANQYQIQIHMDGKSHKKKCGEVDRFYCDLCMTYVTCQATLDSHRKGKKHIKRVKQEEERMMLQLDEQRDVNAENGKPTAKEKQELDMLKLEIRTLQRTVKNLEEFNQHCTNNHSSAEYQELLKYKTWCKDKHIRSKIYCKTSFKELKNETFGDGDVKNEERKEGIDMTNSKG